VAAIDGGRSGSPRVNVYCSIGEVSTDSWKHRWSSHGRILGYLSSFGFVRTDAITHDAGVGWGLGRPSRPGSAMQRRLEARYR
jgi:hypothetical protein